MEVQPKLNALKSLTKQNPSKSQSYRVFGDGIRKITEKAGISKETEAFVHTRAAAHINTHQAQASKTGTQRRETN